MTQAQVNELYRDPSAGAADRPRHRRALPDRLDLQDHHRPGGAGRRRDHALDDDRRQRLDSTVGGQTFQNAGGASYGPLTLVPALQVSSDVFFYELGLQDVGHQPAAALGAQARDRRADRARPARARAEGLVPSSSGATSSTRKANTDRPWSAGDNIQLATGQGDLQTNPLQMAIAYAALGNDGTIVTPHVGMEVEDAAGRVLKEFDPKPRRQIKIDPAYRDGDPGRPARGGAGPGRHLLRRLRRLPDPGRRQDRHGAAPAATPTSPGTRSLAPYPNPAYRHHRDHRGRRLRRRIRGARRAADPRSVLRQAGEPKSRRAERGSAE